MYLSIHQSYATCRYADKLEAAHDGEHLAKFEELLEAAVDLDRIPDEYLICASYDADLQVLVPKPTGTALNFAFGSSQFERISETPLGRCSAGSKLYVWSKCLYLVQELKEEKDEVEKTINSVADEIAGRLSIGIQRLP